MIPVTCDPQNFVASSQHEFDMWTDGINTLLGNPVSIAVCELVSQTFDLFCFSNRTAV